MTISGDPAQRYGDLSAAINDHATALEQLQEHMLAAENAIDMHSHRPIEEMQAAIAALRSEVATLKEEAETRLREIRNAQANISKVRREIGEWEDSAPEIDQLQQGQANQRQAIWFAYALCGIVAIQSLTALVLAGLR